MSSEKDYRLVVFDWDGTLMDSVAEIVGCMRRALTDLGLEPGPDEQLKGVIGLGLREAVAALVPDRDAAFHERVADCYRDHWLSGPPVSRLFPGAETLVRGLHARGTLLGVATGKSRRGLDKSLRESGLHALFHGSRCADETRSKPHPQMLQELIDELGVSPAETVMVGDTEFDLAMAREAGVDPVAVTWGVHEPQRLRRHDPVAVFEAMPELGRWLGVEGHAAPSASSAG